ncbi:MAG: transglutaminase family protein [Chloroflexi bacterium]|nr:transglutaminase family protein [Chloroflexota bacterium]
MKLRIEHRTTFTYDALISEAYTEMRLRPADAGGQIVHSFRLVTEPHGEVLHYIDRYGADVRYFDVLVPHQRLSVTAASEVSTPAQFIEAAVALSPLDEYDYLSSTRYVTAGNALTEFAAVHVKSDVVATAKALMNAIYTQFRYEPGATTVNTSALEVLDLQRGVCQDFAHVMIGLCRSQGIAARYVSGYLYNARVAERDDAASHAWVDVFAPGRGWISLDPTHNCAQGEEYVRLGIGRDYADAPPTRGTYKGAAKEKLEVKVNVRGE